MATGSGKLSVSESNYKAVSRANFLLNHVLHSEPHSRKITCTSKPALIWTPLLSHIPPTCSLCQEMHLQVRFTLKGKGRAALEHKRRSWAGEEPPTTEHKAQLGIVGSSLPDIPGEVYILRCGGKRWGDKGGEVLLGGTLRGYSGPIRLMRGNCIPPGPLI